MIPGNGFHVVLFGRFMVFFFFKELCQVVIGFIEFLIQFNCFVQVSDPFINILVFL